MSFPPYPQYVSSGLDWLGDVPAHWERRRLGYYFSERREKVSDREFLPLSVTKAGIVPQLETAAKTDDGENRKRVCAGDFVINSRSDRQGSAGVSPYDGSVSLISTVLEPHDEVYPPFVHHLLRSQPFQEEYYRFGKGIVADLWSTSYSEMRNITLAMPPRCEQIAIARFLDRETASIDALIAEQDRLSELLKEKIRAYEAIAMSRGLDGERLSTVTDALLPSVPHHWRVVRLSHVLASPPRNGVSPVATIDGVTPTFSVAALRNGAVDIAANLKTTTIGEIDARPYLVAKGDILVMRGSGSQDLVGSAGTVTEEPPEGCIYPDILIRIRPSRDMLPEFLVRMLNSAIMRQQILGAARTAAGIWKISGSALQSLRIPVPPLDEQRRIVSALRSAGEAAGTLVRQANRAVILLEERRSALISAAVTGKIDLCHIADAEAA